MKHFAHLPLVSIHVAVTLGVVTSTASGQSSAAACAATRDSTARQTVVIDGQLTVCLLALRPNPADTTPRGWISRADVVVLETQEPNNFRRFALDRTVSWTINGKPATIDSMAKLWQRGVVDVMDAAFAAERLRAMASGLQATDVILPTNVDSAKAQLASITTQLLQTRAKIGDTWAADQALANQIAFAQNQFDAAERSAMAVQRRPPPPPPPPPASGRGQVGGLTPAEQRAVEAQQGQQGQADQSHQQAVSAGSALGQLQSRRAKLNASGTVKALQNQLRVLMAHKDLLSLQLERLDPSNPRTMERRSIEEEVASKTADVEAELATALLRLRYILGR